MPGQAAATHMSDTKWLQEHQLLREQSLVWHLGRLLVPMALLIYFRLVLSGSFWKLYFLFLAFFVCFLSFFT